MSGENFFIFEQTRNFVTERVTRPGREANIRTQERKFRNKTLKPFEALYIDKLIPVSDQFPCPTYNERIKAINNYNNWVFSRTVSNPIRIN